MRRKGFFSLYFPYTMPSKPTAQSGFSLIEMLVVIGISVMMTTLLLINMRGSTDHVELEGEAYKIATLAREAQTYAISTKTFGPTLTYQSVGVYFVKGSNAIVFFGEPKTPPNPDGKYNAGDQTIKTLTLLSGYTVSSMCTNATTCTTSLNNASVAYQRPFVSASIAGNGATGASYLTITIQSPKQNTRQIQFWTTGQVTVL